MNTLALSKETPMDAITIDMLSKTFKGKRGSVVKALQGVQLSIPQGEIFGFLGPNGAGKSTSIKILMGLIRPTGGQASILGIPIGSHTARRNVGYLPENPSFYDYLNAEEYLTFTGNIFDMTKPLLQERSQAVLRRLNLWDARQRPIRTYSKGMTQRLGLAQVLLHDPQVCILDEPMSGLDPIGRALVKEIILELKAAGKTVFFSTHITSDVEAVCDRVGIIKEGHLRCIERIETIMAAGVTGYQIRHKPKGGGSETATYIPKTDLHRFLTEAAAALEITALEPQRRSLEDFFLEIVERRKG